MKPSAPVEASAHKKRKIRRADDRQLGLFDIDLVPQTNVVSSLRPKATRHVPRRTRNAVHTAPTEGRVRIITLKDMPDYPRETIELVDGSIAALPADVVWLTYREIHKRFGISRATIARRVKEGAIPGIRFQDGRVLDDGPVRRFDRKQVRWLLLAVRAPLAARQKVREQPRPKTSTT